MNTNINSIMSEYAKYQAMENEIAAILDSLKHDIIEYIKASGKEEIQGTEHKASYKSYKRDTFQKDRFMNDHPGMIDDYLKATNYNKFNFR